MKMLVMNENLAEKLEVLNGVRNWFGLGLSLAKKLQCDVQWIVSWVWNYYWRKLANCVVLDKLVRVAGRVGSDGNKAKLSFSWSWSWSWSWAWQYCDNIVPYILLIYFQTSFIFPIMVSLIQTYEHPVKKKHFKLVLSICSNSWSLFIFLSAFILPQ